MTTALWQVACGQGMGPLRAKSVLCDTVRQDRQDMSHAPVVVGHVQSEQDAITQRPVLVRGIGVALGALPMLCSNSSTFRLSYI